MSTGTSLHPYCGIAPLLVPPHPKPQGLGTGYQAGSWHVLPPRVLPTSQSSGAHLAISGLGVCPVMAPKSHIHLWKEGRMVILFTKRLFHNPAASLLDLLSYWSGISCFGSAGEPVDRVSSPRAPMEPGMQSPSAVHPDCSAKASRSLLCWGEGRSVCGLLQPVAN